MHHKQAEDLGYETSFLQFGNKYLSLGENQVQTHFSLVLLPFSLDLIPQQAACPECCWCAWLFLL